MIVNNVDNTILFFNVFLHFLYLNENRKEIDFYLKKKKEMVEKSIFYGQTK